VTSVAVLIPVLDRPHRVEPLVESLRATEPRAIPTFLVTPGDDAELAAVRAVGGDYWVVGWDAGAGDYARKMNYGFTHTLEEWKFLAADDLVFHPGWLDACLAAHARTDACVIGTNDLGNGLVISGRHSTHSLVHRDYLECGTVDAPGLLLHEGYDHNFVDTEFVETAIWRGTFAPARDALVEHLHPFWHKSATDATYLKGQRAYHDDQRLFQTRRRLWT
jgi:hypothetical protein